MDSDYISSIFFSNIQFSTLSTSAIVALICSVFLLAFSAAMSASESAFLSLDSDEKKDIEESESQTDCLIQSFFHHLEKLLITISIWKNFINITIIVLSTYAFHQFVDFSQNPIIGFLCEIIFLTFLILLFGEIMPKLYAQNHSLKVIRCMASLLNFLEKITHPLSSILVKTTPSANSIMRKKSNDVSVDELSKALELTSDELTDEKDMLEGIISLHNKTAAEIMTSRLDIADIDITSGFKEVIAYVIEVEYSRIPVYSGNQDNIRGILYIKDLLPYLDQPDIFCWQKLIRPAFFVPETKKIDDLLEEFRNNKIHMAIVVDEFGGTSGIVTLEDILEEIVGEISDEYDDDEENKYIPQADGSYNFEGKILLTDFFRITNLDTKTFGKLTDEVDTLAGLILEIKRDFPRLEETVCYEKYCFKILEMNERRILKINFKIEE